MKRIICWIKAVPFWLRTGIWTPHRYGETIFEPCMIAATDKNFRVCKNYDYTDKEKIYPRATLMKAKCIYCGREEVSWYSGEIPVIKEK